MENFWSDQIRSIGDKPLKELLKYYGGWPVLEKNWKKPNQSLEEMLGTMHGELNEHFLVSMLVAPDDKNSSVNILVVSSLSILFSYQNMQFNAFFYPHRLINWYWLCHRASIIWKGVAKLIWWHITITWQKSQSFWVLTQQQRPMTCKKC